MIASPGKLTVTSSFCEKMKQKLHQLARMSKLSLSYGCLIEQNVLDLGRGFFSAGCRKATGVLQVSKHASIIKLFFMQI